MKSNGVIVAVMLLSSSLLLLAEDWKTTDGKTYQDVRVVNVQPDTVTILYHDGGATILLANLPPEVQKQFNYDPTKAKTAADSRTKDEIENAKELQAEMDEALRMTEARLAQESNTSSADAGANSESDSSSTAYKGGAHYSLADLDAAVHTLNDNTGSGHYSTSSLGMHTLKAPPDSTHHTVDEIAHGGL